MQVNINHHKKNRLITKVVSSLVLLIVLSCGPSGQAFSQAETVKFSLKEAQEYAVANNINAINARLRIDSARQVVKEVTSVGLPQISGNLFYQRSLQLPTTLIPGAAFGMPEQEFVEVTFGTKNNLTASLDMSQLIFDGTYFLGLKASQLFIDRSEKSARATEINIKDGVTRAYYTVLVAQENLDILQQNTKVLDRVLYETTQLYENGFVEKLEVDRLKLSLANLTTRISSADRQLAVAKDNLKFQLGLDLTKELELAEGLSELAGNADATYLTDVNILKTEAANRRVEMQLLNTGSAFRELDIKQVKSQYLPKLYGFASMQANLQRDDFKIFNSKWFPNSFIGVELKVPIFDGFNKKSKIRQRQIDLKKINNTKELFKESIALEITNAQTAYKNALEQLNHQKATIELAQDVYDGALFKYKEGLGSSLEVADAESVLYESQGLYVQALYNLLIAQTDLDKALGNY